MYQARQSANHNQYLIWPACRHETKKSRKIQIHRNLFLRKTESLQMWCSCEKQPVKLCQLCFPLTTPRLIWKLQEKQNLNLKRKVLLFDFFSVVFCGWWLVQFHVWPVICFYLRRLTAVSLYNLVFHNNDRSSWIVLCPLIFSELAEYCT